MGAKQQWRGFDLPDGLTVERADAAAKLIYDYECADLNRKPHSEVMSLGELVLALSAVFCEGPGVPSPTAS